MIFNLISSIIPVIATTFALLTMSDGSSNVSINSFNFLAKSLPSLPNSLSSEVPLCWNALLKGLNNNSYLRKPKHDTPKTTTSLTFMFYVFCSHFLFSHFLFKPKRSGKRIRKKRKRCLAKGRERVHHRTDSKE